jgi:hypothetical protein
MILLHGLLLIGLITSVCTIILYTKTRNEKINGNIYILWIIRWIHFTTLCFSLLYLFIFNSECDFIFIGLSIIIGVSWLLFKKECILSYIEKHEMNKDYQLGSRIYEHPFIDLLVGDKYKKLIWISIAIVTNVVLIIVLLRIVQKYVKNMTYKIPLYILFIMNFIYNMYTSLKRI